MHHRGQGTQDKEMTERLLYLGPQKVVSLPMGMEGAAEAWAPGCARAGRHLSEVFQAEIPLWQGKAIQFPGAPDALLIRALSTRISSMMLFPLRMPDP